MGRPVKILQIANQAGPLRLFMLPVCRELKKLGHQVELACMEFGPNYGPLREAGFPLHGLPAGPWSNPLTWLRTYRAVKSLLRAGQYDLMVVHTPIMSWIARYAARKYVPAVIYMAHGLPFAPTQGCITYRVMRMAEQFAGRYTDGLIVMNAVDAEACGRFPLTKPGGKWFKAPGVGVDVDKFAAPPASVTDGGIDAEFGLAPGSPVVLYLGRFIKSKRPGDILKLAERTGPAVSYVLAGEGPLWPHIKKRAAEIGPHVHVLGWTDRVFELTHRCTVGVFPSLFREGLPRFLLEAQAAGKPVVAYDVRGSSDAIDNGKTGVLAPPGDVEGLIKAVQTILGDADAARRMGEAARSWVSRNFSLSAAVSAQIDAITKVIGENPAGRNS